MTDSVREFYSIVASALVTSRIVLENHNLTSVHIAANGPTIGEVIERALSKIKEKDEEAKSKEKGNDSEEATPWHVGDYRRTHDQTMPAIGRQVLIRVIVAQHTEELFIAIYNGNGQFRIETKAELHDMGFHHKLTSSMHASFVTHWVYITRPEEG